MSRLILMRHGKAEIAGPTGGDRERPLSARGRTEAALTAQWLAAAGLSPALALISPALRTLQTWSCAGDAFPNARSETREGLYLAGPEVMLEVILAVPAEAGALMIIGHNPGLQELGVRLAVEGAVAAVQLERLADGFPTATAWVFRLRDGRGDGLEAAYEPPRVAGQRPPWAFLGPDPGAAP
jgi:phosphohistidine phosphatase